ncbi:unnamed protein product [Orchesella dallaii]|uniref:Uncharacterized protein n=1 Tax=Orchesella dallaii TaxID=48710 RepID=A0ABP1QGG0_9HEXA
MAKFNTAVVLFFAFSSALAWTVSLDKSSDESRMWKIKDSVYLSGGEDLQGAMREYLPKGFQFNNFALSKGIWVVVPNKKNCDATPKNDDAWMNTGWDDFSSEVISTNSNSSSTSSNTPKSVSHCNTTATGIFQLKMSAQLLASVKVTFNYGGNSTIRITGARGHPFEEFADGKQFDNWIETSIPLDGRLMLLEAIVYGDGDYILIDKIEAEVSAATTTSTTKQTTTTEKPQPPASGQSAVEATLTIFLALMLHKLMI